MRERSSGKAHHKATKFFDFTAPPREKNRRILHKQLMQEGLQAGGESWVSDLSDPSDPSDLPDPSDSSDPSDPSDLSDLSDLSDSSDSSDTDRSSR